MSNLIPLTEGVPVGPEPEPTAETLETWRRFARQIARFLLDHEAGSPDPGEPGCPEPADE